MVGLGASAVCSRASLAQVQSPKGRETGNWGTYLRPFAADSLWNSRPAAPVLGDFVVPKSDYFPSVSEGAYGTGVFLAQSGDRPATITGLPGQKGLWNPDAEGYQDVIIPRWPVNVMPAEGNDGHAEVVDPVLKVVHSFWQLRRIDGRWCAAQYAWTRLDGRGWGDPAHYFQGARAAAVPTTAGLIRKHEVADGLPMYSHALALSLTFNALSPKPSYIFPATSGDSGADKSNSGQIPEGALLMLPDTFDAGSIANADLRKVVQTLKIYGAYVVDRNHGTPFGIYVETGAGYNLHRGGWSNVVAADLDRIRQALRQVVSAGGWIDGNGKRFVPERNLNLLSMRGPWRNGTVVTPGAFDSWAQAVVFPPSPNRVLLDNVSGRGMNTVHWGIPEAGARYRLTANCIGGAKMRMLLHDRKTAVSLFDSGELGEAESVAFEWPAQPAALVLHAIGGVGQPSSVRGHLVAASK
jgi:hypothetical protein